MRDLNLSNVEAATEGEFKKVKPGGYICKIVTVSDVEAKEYLKIEYDIAQGEYKDFYNDLSIAKQFWGGTMYKSYKESCLSFFKGFTTAVEESNKGFKFGSDEKALVGKLVGLVLAEEEYWGNDGSLKGRLYVAQVRSIEAIKSKDFTVPELKKVAGSPANVSRPSSDGFNNVSDDPEEGLPFK